MWKEFKTFALRGNMLDMAVGIIIGAAFSSLVNSLVNDLIMPPIGAIAGGVDFSDLFFNLGKESYQTLEEAQNRGAPTLNYGLFINNIINFLIVSFSVFFLIKLINTFHKKQQAASEPTEEVKLLTEIRDSLKK